jgi:flagellar export protein FliJ
MKKFQYNFERILHYLKIEEDLAGKDFLDARAKVEVESEKLIKLYESVEEAGDLAVTYKKEGNQTQQKLDLVDIFKQGQKIRIERQSTLVRKAKQVCEEKENILKEKKMRREIFEKLKDKKKLAYKEEVKKWEMKQLDDMVSTRFKRAKT